MVLSRLDDSPQSLFQKFWFVATQARFAIVLLSPDDYGASRRQYEAVNVAEKALQFRARQNVILELGFLLRPPRLGERIRPSAGTGSGLSKLRITVGLARSYL